MRIFLSNTGFFKRYWKWIISCGMIIFFIGFFFFMTGNATFRYGYVHLQSHLVNDAMTLTLENQKVKEKFGELEPYDFLKLMEGAVFYDDNTASITITVGIAGSKRKGKLDIWARKVHGNWKYDSIIVRTKKPEKMRILVFKKPSGF